MRVAFLSIFSISIALMGPSPTVAAQAVTGGRQESADLKHNSAAAAATPEAQTAPKKPRLARAIHVVPFIEPGTPKPLIFAAGVAGAHVDYFGGPVISNVHLVQVLYGTGSYVPNVSSRATPSVASFFTDITQSSYFDMLNEYSTVGAAAADGGPSTNQTIGHGFFDGQFTITPSPANSGANLTDTQIQNELLIQVGAGHLPAPVSDNQGNNNTLYMIYFPQGTSIALDSTTHSCVRGGFCAYHNSTNTASPLYYGVHPDVQPPSLCSVGCGGGTPFDIVTNVTSHELSEAVTDANVGNANSLGRPLAWVDPVNSEIGDICAQQEATVTANGTVYTVQTEFSNFQNTCTSQPANFAFVNGPFSTVAPGTEMTLPVSLQTGASNFVGDYRGTVHFTSSDNAAVLPADYTYNTADAASHQFVFTLNKPGLQTITATDPQRPGVTGSTTISVVADAATRLRVVIPAQASVGVPITVTVTALDNNFEVVKGDNRTVHFSSGDGLAVLPADAPLVNGTGSFSVTLKTTGVQSLSVADAANNLVNGQVLVNVSTPGANATTTTVVASSTPPFIFGQPISFTATLTSSGSFNLPAVTFISDGGAQSVVVRGDNTGHATGSLTLFGGTHTVFAEFSGDGAHDPSSSAPLTVTVNPGPTNVNVTSSQSTSTFGTIVTFTASLNSSAANAVPGFQPFPGIITFSDGSVPLAAISAPISSTVSLGSGALSPGSHSITAAYSGNSSFAASTSTSLAQTVNAPPPADYSITPDKASVTLLAGQSATFNIQATGLNFFSGTVTFNCGNLPALTTCTLSNPVVVVDPVRPIAFTNLTIKTSGPHARLDFPRREHNVYAALWGLGAMALGITLIAGTRSQKRRRTLSMILSTLLLTTVLASCGGGSHAQPTPTPIPTPTPPPTTPAGTTTMRVSAVGLAISGANPARQSQQLNLTITVQP